MNKKVIIGIVIVTVILLTVLGVTLYLNKRITTKDFKNEAFKITYDSTWKVTEDTKYLALQHNKTKSTIKIQYKMLDESFLDTNLSQIIDDLMDSIVDQNTGFNLINYNKNNDKYDSFSYLYEKEKEQVLVRVYKKDCVLLVMYYSADSEVFDIVLDSVDTMLDTLEIYSGEK